jgi:peptidase A4-like protein
MFFTRRGIAAGCVCALAIAVAGFAPAGASALPDAHGNLVKIVKPGARANANESSNWFGYNQGTLEQGGRQFHSIAGDWVVPRATQHVRGRAEASSTWVGIGGGCVDAKCNVGDTTLIQTGTEQDVSKSGKASYSAWWEIIPGPSITIPKLRIRPGDHLHAAITEAVKNSDVWRITLRNVTRNQTFRKTVPYTSTHATAEWIQETPVIIGTDAGFADLPNLSRNTFNRARVNGKAAGLKYSERMLLTSGNNNRVIGTPSAPDRQHDGFALCSWAKRCPAP